MPRTTGNGTRRTRSTTKKDMDAIRSGLASAEPEDDKTKTARKARRTKVEQDVAELTQEKIANSIAKVSVDLSKQLNIIGEATREKAEEYRVACEAVDLKKEELEELHGKAVAAFAIDDLVAQHDEKKNNFEQEVADTKAEWESEQQEHEHSVIERDAALDRSRKQDADEFNYNLKITRRNEQDAFDQQKRERDRARQDEEDDFVARCKTKQQELDEYAKKLNEKTEEVVEREGELETKITEAVATKEKSLRGEYGNKMKYAELENDKQVELLKQQLTTFQGHITNLEAQNDEKQKKITDLQNQLTAMATKSLEIGSGKALADAKQEVVEKMGQKR
jgi:hypothetical protein